MRRNIFLPRRQTPASEARRSLEFLWIQQFSESPCFILDASADLSPHRTRSCHCFLVIFFQAGLAGLDVVHAILPGRCAAEIRCPLFSRLLRAQLSELVVCLRPFECGPSFHPVPTDAALLSKGTLPPPWPLLHNTAGQWGRTGGFGETDVVRRYCGRLSATPPQTVKEPPTSPRFASAFVRTAEEDSREIGGELRSF